MGRCIWDLSQWPGTHRSVCPPWAGPPHPSQGAHDSVCSLQRLLLLLQDKDKEVEELLQEIQCEKVPSPTVAPRYGPVELSG